MKKLILLAVALGFISGCAYKTESKAPDGVYSKTEWAFIGCSLKEK